MLEAFMAVPLYLVAVFVSGFVKRFACKARLLAVPNLRSSHSVITPVGGGLGIVLAFVIALILNWYGEGLGDSELLLLFGSLPVAFVGLLDDRWHVDFRVRLFVQWFVMIWALIWLGPFPPIMVGTLELKLGVLTWVIVPIFLIWLSNLYNFMDGIDGLAGIEACFVSAAASFLLLLFKDYSLGLICLFLFAANAGFLVWNLSPAKIFMGDVGSGFLGCIFGLMALLSHLHGSISLWCWLILLEVFIVDATVTLLRRLLSGQSWHQAHRSHAYQNASQRMDSHARVSFFVLLINLFWLFPLAALAAKHPEYGVYLAITGGFPLVILAAVYDAGKTWHRQVML